MKKTFKNALTSTLCLAVSVIMIMLSSCAGNDTATTSATSAEKTTISENTSITSATSAEKTTVSENTSVTSSETKENATTTKNEQSADKKTSANKTNSAKSGVSAKEFVKNIKCGWNLGNTFDSHKTDVKNPTVNEIETSWGAPTTTKAMIDEVSRAGFNAIRIPVTYSTFTTKSNGKYTVDEKWLKRVKEVVNYAYSRNLYIIINMHHDDDTWLDISKTGKDWEEIKTRYKQIWKQVATYFKNYNEKIIFEGMNELVGKNADGNDDWWGQTDAPFEHLNELYKIFVDTVRATGGKNESRYLMISTLGAQWYAHQLSKVTIPNNDDKVIVDVHWYTESTDATSIESTMQVIADYSDKFPIILGECGIQNQRDDATKKAWAKAYVGTANKLGLACFIWDDAGNYAVMDRKNLTWHSNDLVKTFVNLSK